MHKRTVSNGYQQLGNINKTIQPKEFLSPYNKKNLKTSAIFLKKNHCKNKKYKPAPAAQNTPKSVNKCIYSNITKDYLNSLKLKFSKRKKYPLKTNLKSDCITPKGCLENKFSKISPRNLCNNNIYRNLTNDSEFNFLSSGNLDKLVPNLSYIQLKNLQRSRMAKSNILDKSNKSEIINESKNGDENTYIDSIRSEVIDLKKLVGNLNKEINRINNNQQIQKTRKTIPAVIDDKDKDSLIKKNKDLEKKNEHYLNIIKLKDTLIKELEANQNSEKCTMTLESKQQNNDFTFDQEEKNVFNETNEIQKKNSRTTDNSSKKNSATFKFYEGLSKEYIKKIEEQNNKITQLTIENNKLSLEIKEKNKINEKLSKEIDDLQNRISSFISENKELEDKFNEMQSNKIMESVEKNILIQDLNEEINNLKIENLKKISEQKKTIKILNDKIEILDNELQNSNNNNEQVEQLIKIIKLNLDSSQKLKEEIHNMSESKMHNEKIKELNEIISKNEENTNKVKSQIETLVLKITNLEKKNKNLIEQLNEKENMINRYNDEIEKCENLQELRFKVKDIQIT